MPLFFGKEFHQVFDIAKLTEKNLLSFFLMCESCTRISFLKQHPGATSWLV
jgi:hypothetical protein